MPKETSSKRLFWVTYVGLALPIISIEIMGALALTTFKARPDWAHLCELFALPSTSSLTAVEEGAVGGLLAGLLQPSGGFGQFLLVILGLSTVSVVIT